MTVLAVDVFLLRKRLTCDLEHVEAARPDDNIWSAETLMEPKDGDDVLYINKDAHATNPNAVRNRVRLLLMSELQALHLKKLFYKPDDTEIRIDWNRNHLITDMPLSFNQSKSVSTLFVCSLTVKRLKVVDLLNSYDCLYFKLQQNLVSYSAQNLKNEGMELYTC